MIGVTLLVVVVAGYMLVVDFVNEDYRRSCIAAAVVFVYGEYCYPTWFTGTSAVAWIIVSAIIGALCSLYAYGFIKIKYRKKHQAQLTGIGAASLLLALMVVLSLFIPSVYIIAALVLIGVFWHFFM